MAIDDDVGVDIVPDDDPLIHWYEHKNHGLKVVGDVYDAIWYPSSETEHSSWNSIANQALRVSGLTMADKHCNGFHFESAGLLNIAVRTHA